MDIIIWTYILGGATIFGIIVGVFSVYNGRTTRRELSLVIERGNQRTQELLKETQELIERGNQRTQELLKEIVLYMQDMDRRHTELMAQMVSRGTPS